MPYQLSWNEINANAAKFAREWLEDIHSLEQKFTERAQKDEFLLDFMDVFGLDRRKGKFVFEATVKMPTGTTGFIDLFKAGLLLVEMKTPGKSLDSARAQAFEYVVQLAPADRPKLVLVSDFVNFHLYDLARDLSVKHGEQLALPMLELIQPEIFELAAFEKHTQLFGPLIGARVVKLRAEDPANREAAELMADLHDAMRAVGYEDHHQLGVYLVRILFCLFAEDTGIFNPMQFTEYIKANASSDGKNLDDVLRNLFSILDKAPDKRLRTSSELLQAFPHVNGELFKETLDTAGFTALMLNKLLVACAFDWSKISPAIFGALFQGVMNPIERRKAGAHYTSEQNILKAIDPLFMDELRADFEKAGQNTKQLKELQERLSKLRVLDPACGCGNFLVVAYREVRALEFDIMRRLLPSGDVGRQTVLDVGQYLTVQVSQFAGIEYDDFPCQIARLAMWLTEHQANQEASREYGRSIIKLPLTAPARIVCGNALRTDWGSLLPEGEVFDYIVGNPPFLGGKMQSESQREDQKLIWGTVKGAGNLDYVTNWFYKSAAYADAHPLSRVALVSTNSITQGEQPGVLWTALKQKFGVKIRFGHQTFRWRNEAKGNAAVHVVIIGFDKLNKDERTLYTYLTLKSEPVKVLTTAINPYLVQGSETVILSRESPICDVPRIGIGNKPIDGGNYLFTIEEKNAFIKIEPLSEKWFRSWLGSREFLHGYERACLWLGDCPPNELRKMHEALKRVDAVRSVRLASRASSTRDLAEKPTRFHVENMPDTDYLLIPRVSSELRPFIPMGFLDSTFIASDATLIIPNATLFHFGVLQSTMHMAWVRAVCGRLKSDFRYSNTIVYNNFPWPHSPEPLSEAQEAKISAAAQAVLDARLLFQENGGGSSLADLYDPLAMPAELRRAHAALDKAVDAAYRKAPFATEADRVAFLFERYAALTKAGELDLKEAKAEKVKKPSTKRKPKVN